MAEFLSTFKASFLSLNGEFLWLSIRISIQNKMHKAYVVSPNLVLRRSFVNMNEIR